MKKWAFLFAVCFLNNTGVICQTINETSDLRILSFDEWSAKYSTLDDKNKMINAVSVCELTINGKRCLENPVEVKLNADSKMEFKNLTWYQWDIQKKRWVKESTPKFRIDRNKKNGAYYAYVNCPGVYGFFYPDEKLNSGLKIKAPSGCKIQTVSIAQKNPSTAYNALYTSPASSVTIPITDLQFAGYIDVELIDKEGKQFTLKNNLIGAHIDLREGFDKNETVNLKISRSDLLEKQILSNK